MKFKELLFGTAGIPLGCLNCDTRQGIRKVRELGLGSMELEFVHSINISKERAPEVKKVSAGSGIVLSCHGSYYINLNAKEEGKRNRSSHMLLSTARRAWECGAFSLTFHPGYYLGMEKQAVYKRVKEKLVEIVNALQEEGIGIIVSPETTGKQSQFGSLEELIGLSSEIAQTAPCIDFAHLHAKSRGKLNGFQGFSDVLEQIEKDLGREYLERLHCHVSGIEFTEKGEKKHLPLKESTLDFNGLMKALKEFKVKGSVICESPLVEKDAVLLKKTFEDL